MIENVLGELCEARANAFEDDASVPDQHAKSVSYKQDHSLEDADEGIVSAT